MPRKPFYGHENALQQLGGLVDAEPLEPLIADLSLLLGANPERGAGAKGGGRPPRKRQQLGVQGPNAWASIRSTLIRRRINAQQGSRRGGRGRAPWSRCWRCFIPHLACIPSSPSYKTFRAHPRKMVSIADGIDHSPINRRVTGGRSPSGIVVFSAAPAPFRPPQSCSTSPQTAPLAARPRRIGAQYARCAGRSGDAAGRR